jgi:acetyl esterase/lipase
MSAHHATLRNVAENLPESDILTRPAPQADERVAYGDAPSQFADFRYPATSGPLVVMIHGGFWRSRYTLSHAGHLCDALTQAGFITANLEYRRLGEPGGGWRGTFDDIEAGFEFACRHAGCESALAVGHSAGGHLALWLASRAARLCGVAALAPVACVRLAWQQNLSNGAAGELLGSPAEFPERYAYADPSELQTETPRVLIHGTQDDIVPIALSREYVERQGGELVELPDAGHLEVIDPLSPAFTLVRDRLEAYRAGR